MDDNISFKTEKFSNINIDYLVFIYSLAPTKIKNLSEAKKDFKFLDDDDKNKSFWFTSVFTRSISANVVYTHAISLFDNTHQVLNFSKMDSKIFTLSQEKDAFQFFGRMKNMFLPARQAQFLYKGAARPQLEIDQMLIVWSQGLKDLIK